MNEPDPSRLARKRLPSPGCLFVVLLAAFVVSLGSWFEWRAYRQRAVLGHIERLGGYCNTQPATPIWLHDLVESAVGEQHATGYTELRMVVLQHTDISDEDLRCLAGQSNLKSLWLNDTQISGTGLQYLRGTRLEALVLAEAPVTDAGLEHLSDLHTLQHLLLSDTPITDAGLAHLSNLSGLRELHLGGTQVTDDGLRHLAGLTDLRWLELNETSVTDAGLVHLDGLPRLHHVKLRNTAVTTRGVDQLYWKHPGIAIDW